MDKVFAIVEQVFFVSNGIDYAMAMNEDDVDLFSNYDKAIDFFEDRTEEISRFYNIDYQTIQNTDNRKVNLWTRPNGSRIFLKLIEMNIK